MMTALTRCWTKLAKAASMVRSLLAFSTRSSMPSARAATCTSLVWDSEVGFPALIRNSDNSGARDQHPQRFQPFCPECGDNKTHARDIAAGTVETGNKTEFDRVSADHENNRNCCGCSSGGYRSRRGERNDRGHPIGHQIRSQCRQPVEASIGRAIFYRDIAAFDVATVFEPLPDSTDLPII